ncbi:MAG: aminotransferase class V-fold PLP-dependent enzyme [Planctomycetes bacterium]|nr:aminotransferase class V-fold PLP-dependent enzyme [Planctomycetota bacterium]
MARLIYLDNNATTRPLDAVVEAMLPFMREQYANPSSVHRFGQSVRHQVELAREKVAALIGASAKEITFTSGGTEAINLAVRGTLAVRPERRHVITTAVEHSAVRKLCSRLGEEGYDVDEVGVNGDGCVDPEEITSRLRDETAIVSVMHANNETGVLFDVERIAAVCSDRGVPLHVDAVQSAGKVPLDVGSLPATMLTLSAHKLHGPKGVGALYVRSGTRLEPLMLGGGQERGLRGGTENVAAIVGMGVAAKAAMGDAEVVRARMKSLRDLLEDGLRRVSPGARVIAGNVDRLCNTLNVAFAGIQAEAILLLLSEAGICASSGSACSSGSIELSHVLQAMGIEERLARGAVRFSLSSLTTRAEIDQVISTVARLLSRLGAT